MDHHTERHDRDRDRHPGTGSTLARLEDLGDYEIADGQPDIRGWKVRTADGTIVGKVDNLIADPQALEVRFIEMTVNGDIPDAGDDDRVLIPIESARLNDDDDTVLVDRLTPSQLGAIPRCGRGPITAEQDRAVRAYFFGATAPPDPAASGRFFGNRGGTNSYFTRSMRDRPESGR